MQLEITQVLFQSAVFCGASLGTNANVASRSGLKMVYDREEKELIITLNGIKAIVLPSNIISMIPAQEVPAKGPAEPPKATKPVKTAQASSPTSHVFAGPGAGVSK